jgi:hypothetical protein
MFMSRRRRRVLAGLRASIDLIRKTAPGSGPGC